MTDQSRVNAGVPTGGQFAGHERPEATIALLNDALIEQSKAELRVAWAVTRAIAEKVVAEYPNAHTLRLTKTDGGVRVWRNSEILDEHGETIELFDDANQVLVAELAELADTLPADGQFRYQFDEDGRRLRRPANHAIPWLNYRVAGPRVVRSNIEIDLRAALEV